MSLSVKWQNTAWCPKVLESVLAWGVRALYTHKIYKKLFKKKKEIKKNLYGNCPSFQLLVHITRHTTDFLFWNREHTCRNIQAHTSQVHSCMCVQTHPHMHMYSHIYAPTRIWTCIHSHIPPKCLPYSLRKSKQGSEGLQAGARLNLPTGASAHFPGSICATLLLTR